MHEQHSMSYVFELHRLKKQRLSYILNSLFQKLLFEGKLNDMLHDYIKIRRPLSLV